MTPLMIALALAAWWLLGVAAYAYIDSKYNGLASHCVGRMSREPVFGFLYKLVAALCWPVVVIVLLNIGGK